VPDPTPQDDYGDPDAPIDFRFNWTHREEDYITVIRYPLPETVVTLGSSVDSIEMTVEVKPIYYKTRFEVMEDLCL